MAELYSKTPTFTATFTAKMIKLVVLSLFLVAVTAKVVTVRKCGPTDVEMRIPVCKSEPCELKRGSSSSVEVDFVSPIDSQRLTADIRGTVLGLIPIPWPGMNTDGCKDSGIECPIKKGQKYTYKINFDVRASWPRISSKVTFKLSGDSGVAFCVNIPIRLV